MDVRKRLGSNIKRLRKEKGISQEELADLVGVHRTYESDIERGTRNPSILVLEKFGKALKVRPGSLLD
jgi:transcriptional regulator with XRE-family HTH domain